jgi:hypothetical protein
MLRFSIRDVLWLTVVVGLALGWLVERRQERVLREQLKRAWWHYTPGFHTGVEPPEVDWSVLGPQYLVSGTWEETRGSARKSPVRLGE